MANIKDVAKLAGVSVTTVSRALNNSAPVNKSTREKIEEAISELGYVPDNTARAMRTNSSKTIGIIFPEYSNSYYFKLFQLIENEAFKHGYRVMVTTSSTNDVNFVNDFIGRRMDAIVVCSYGIKENIIDYLTTVQDKIPVIFMDNIKLQTAADMIYIDGHKAISDVVNYLYSIGHRKIGYLKGKNQNAVAFDRYKGYVDTMNTLGLSINSNWVFQGDYHIESGFLAASYYLHGCSERPTAIVSSSDLMAVGLINGLMLEGIKIPDDIAVTGFDDITESRIVSPSLTTIAQPYSKLAKTTVQRVLERIKNKNIKPESIVLNGCLIVRNSTDKNQSVICKI